MFKKQKNKIDLNGDKLELVKFHVMSDDLNERHENSESENNKEEINLTDNTKIQENSPFLNFSNVEKNEAESLSSKEMPLNKAQDVVKLDQQKDDNNFAVSELAANNLDGVENSDEKIEDKKNSFFVYSLILVVILLIGSGGGYYFWINREDKTINNQTIQDNPKEEDEIANVANDLEETDKSDDNPLLPNDISDDVDFSDKTNFIVINDEKLTPEGIRATIEEKFTTMTNFSGNQLEFLVVDKNNKPINFKDFASNFGISLNADVLDNLELDNFSLFLYKNNQIKRVGLLISVKNKDLLSMNLAKNEKNLVNSLMPIYIYEKPINNNEIKFGISKYNDNLIKYVNLNKDLSLDYSVAGSYLMLATNKECGRLILDKINGELIKNEEIFSPGENLNKFE